MKTTEKFVEEADKKHNGKYDYSRTIYKGAKEKVEIICPEHGVFFQTPTAHLRPCGCPECGFDTIKTKRWGEHNAMACDEFTRKAALKHDGCYSYNKVEWQGSKTKVKILCPKHGPFMQSPEKHLGGNGCPTCGKSKSVDLRRSNTEEFIQKAQAVHGDKYDYSKTTYVENEGSVEIICPIHGAFWQRGSNHLQGKGCLRCSNNEPMNQEEFITKALLVHSTKYDYSKTEYKGAKEKITVICKDHGKFSQQAAAHLLGQGCPRCSIKISKGESEIFTYVKSFCPDAIQSDRTVLDGKEIDIFIPSKNIGIEFNGLIWHSTKHGKSRTYHQDKSDLAATKGVRLIHIWEDEWRDKRAWCEAFIARLFSDTSRKVFARKCSIEKIEADLSKPFLNDNHLQGFRGGQHVGMFHNGELVAVATHGMNQKGEHELLRWCVKLGVSVVGGFSRIMKHLPANIISFCDTAKHDAAGYLASGWKIHSETVLMYYYTNGFERVSRQRFQKHKLVKIKGASGTTEKELAASLGFYQLGALKQLKLVRG